MKTAILGSTGYIGQVTLRLLLNHPHVSEIYAVSSGHTGESVFDRDPGLSRLHASKLASTNGKYCGVSEVPEVDVVFAALPHLKSAEIAAPFLDNGKSVVIDLSADFRIADSEIFTQAYGQAPPRPDLLEKAVYGLSEWNRDAVAKADLIANPGCYPTATLLPLLPVVEAGLHDGSAIIINAMSGISGAGRKAAEHLLYTSRTENTAAYAPGRSHRHWQEIQSRLDLRTRSAQAPAYFTPHLVPVHHGMEVTTSLTLAEDCSDSDLDTLFASKYETEPFVEFRRDIPETSQVRNTNRCDFTWRREGRQLFLISVIDNLYKGAAGQALQNMNIRFGFDETEGLDYHGEI